MQGFASMCFCAGICKEITGLSAANGPKCSSAYSMSLKQSWKNLSASWPHGHCLFCKTVNGSKTHLNTFDIMWKECLMTSEWGTKENTYLDAVNLQKLLASVLEVARKSLASVLQFAQLAALQAGIWSHHQNICLTTLALNVDVVKLQMAKKHTRNVWTLTMTILGTYSDTNAFAWHKQIRFQLALPCSDISTSAKGRGRKSYGLPSRAPSLLNGWHHISQRPWVLAATRARTGQWKILQRVLEIFKTWLSRPGAEIAKHISLNVWRCTCPLLQDPPALPWRCPLGGSHSQNCSSPGELKNLHAPPHHHRQCSSKPR